MSQAVSDKAIHLNEESFEKILASDVPVVVDFWAEWCGPCRMLGPVVEELAANFAGRAVIAKVNVDENNILAGKLGIFSIPNVKIFKNRKEVENIIGAVPYGVLSKALEKHL